jgi:DNA-binding transcriptional LysR family regulator
VMPCMTLKAPYSCPGAVPPTAAGTVVALDDRCPHRLLERAIGAKVFERGARGSTLTPVGEIVARNARNVDCLLSRVHKEIQSHSVSVSGPITVGATPSMMLGLVPAALTRLSVEFPRMAVTLIEGLDGQLIPALERGEIDFLVGPLDGLHNLRRRPFLSASRPTIISPNVSNSAFTNCRTRRGFFRYLEAPSIKLPRRFFWPLACHGLRTASPPTRYTRRNAS